MRRKCRSTNGSFNLVPKLGGRMSMEEGKGMGGSGEGGGNCGGRRLGSPPAATAAVAGQGGGSGARGMRREGVARRCAWAPSRRLAGETTEGPLAGLRICEI